MAGAKLEVHLVHRFNQFLHGIDRLVHHGLLFGIKLELDDILNPLLAQDCRNTHIVTVYTELALEEAAGRQNALLVLEDRLGHCDGGRSGE